MKIEPMSDNFSTIDFSNNTKSCINLIDVNYCIQKLVTFRLQNLELE